jgi:predicted RNA binding protein YcfA (HicA-like mRNA interferase family)
VSPKLPSVSAKETIGVFQKIGYTVVRQRGSRIRLRDLNNPSHNPLTVPNHKEIKPGLLRKMIKDANLTIEEFIRLLKEQKNANV